jgi:ubiquitin-protein ligase E3 C
LKSAQQEREKRETIRLNNKSATCIQAACRRYIDLRNWRLQLSLNWDNKSIIEFKYFFSYMITEQSYGKSIDQLHKINNQIPDLNEKDLMTLSETLVISAIKLTAKNDISGMSLIKELLLVLYNVLNKQNHPDLNQYSEKFTKSLISLYNNKQLFALYFIYVFVSILSIYELLLFYISASDIFEDTISNKWENHYELFEITLFEKLIKLKDVLTCLPDDQKVLFLSRISTSVHKYPQFYRRNGKNYFSVIHILLNSITKRINIDQKEQNAMDVENQEVHVSGSTINISLNIFNLIKLLYQAEDFQLFYEQETDPDFLISYISALLHFASLVINDRSNFLKLYVDLNWILKDKNLELIPNCFNKISSYKQLSGLQSIPNSQLELFLDVESNRKWWNALSVFQEFLMNIITYTPDENFFSAIIIQKDEFIDFAEFLKLLVSELLVKYRDINKSDTIDRSLFLTHFKKLLTLIHALYMKDLKLKIFEDEFWILKTFEFESKSVASTIPIIDKIHYDMTYDDHQDGQIHYDFLQNSKLVNLYKSNIPKRVIDSLYILTYVPYMIPFEKRAEIFHAFINNDKNEHHVSEWFPTKAEGIISRDNILFDSFKAFGNLRGAEFKKPFSVQFVNQFGEKEAGIDGGGLTKELLTSFVSSVFLPSEENRVSNKGLQFFKMGENYKLYFNPEFFFKLQYEKSHPTENIPYACSNEDYLKICNFIGKIIGKCLYDNVLVDISFASFFLNTCATIGGKYFRNLIGDKVDFIGHSNSFDELKNLDLSLYQSLNYLLRQTEDQNFQAMGLEFVIDDMFFDMNGVKHHVSMPLLPFENSAPIPVNNENKMQFARIMSYFRLSKQTDSMMKSFVEGLFQVIKPYWLLLFNPNELQTLISGDDDINIDDLHQNVEYGGGYMAHDKTIVDLFEILKEFNHDERAKFIKFVTSSSKQPLLGFKELSPKFGIFNAGSDVERLPTASTCVNLLKLPNYKNKKQLKEKLLYSINSKAGFDLS